MIEAVRQLNTRLAQARGVQLAVRLGMHTGLVVVGEMGGGGRHEQLALGDPPISPPTSRPNPGSCEPLPAWPGSGSARASASRPTYCWLPSTGGSPKVLTRPTSRRPGRCWRNWGGKDRRQQVYPFAVLQRICTASAASVSGVGMEDIPCKSSMPSLLS
jgi:hypothetical protein